MCVMYKDWRMNHLGELFDASNDREQRNNIAKENPEVTSLMNKKYREWYVHTTGDIKNPVRFILGDERAPLISLTTQDIYMPTGNSAFAQKHVSTLNEKNGPWKIQVAKSGKYKFTLSRYPLYTDLPFNINAHDEEVNFDASLAKISVGGQLLQKEIVATNNHVVFEMDLEAGDTDLQTWLISSDGQEIPSYFVDIEIY